MWMLLAIDLPFVGHKESGMGCVPRSGSTALPMVNTGCHSWSACDLLKSCSVLHFRKVIDGMWIWCVTDFLTLESHHHQSLEQQFCIQLMLSVEQPASHMTRPPSRLEDILGFEFTHLWRKSNKSHSAQNVVHVVVKKWKILKGDSQWCLHNTFDCHTILQIVQSNNELSVHWV